MNTEQADEYLKVLVSAYVWVASADGRVDENEMAKYEHVLVQSPFATQFEDVDVSRYFKDTVAMFDDNYDTATQFTKDELGKIANQGHLAEEVIRVCRAAIVGDGRIEESEEVVLKEISRILGIKADF